MRKKGFTLIELLAVILILAIIAVIVTPIISKIIDEAKAQSDKRSAEKYVRAAQTFYMESQMDESKRAVLGTNIIDRLDLENIRSTGTVVAYPDGTVEMAIVIGTRCFTKTTTQDIIDIQMSKDTENCTVLSGSAYIDSINSGENSIEISTNNSADPSVTMTSCKYGTEAGNFNLDGTISGNTCTLSPTTVGIRYYYVIKFSDDSSKSGSVQGGSGVITPTPNNGGGSYSGGSGASGGSGSGGTGVAGPVLEGEFGQTIYTGTYLTRAAFKFFNVTTGEKCTMSEWQNNGSTENFMRSGCLRFYAYMEDKLSYTMILDRNMIGNTQFAGNGTDDPTSVISSLKSLTSNWQGTVTPKNYTYSTPNKMYLIPYEDEGYHARLITADEVAHIVGKRDFNTTSTTADNWFYLDGGTSASTGQTWQTQIATATEPSAYYWLYSYLNGSCAYGAYNCDGWYGYEGGCNSGSNYPCEGPQNFWTSDKVVNNASGYVWVVSNTGKLVSHSPNGVFGKTETDNHVGIRPVITVLKSVID